MGRTEWGQFSLTPSGSEGRWAPGILFLLLPVQLAPKPGIWLPSGQLPKALDCPGAGAGAGAGSVPVSSQSPGRPALLGLGSDRTGAGAGRLMVSGTEHRSWRWALGKNS